MLVKMDDKEYWSKFSGRLEPKHQLQVQQWLEFYVPKKVLEVGCGLGHYMFAFEDHGIDVKGFDISAEAIEKCPYNSIKQHLKVGSVTKIPYSEKFDFVLCYDVMEHIALPDIEPAFEEIKRVSSKYVLFGITFINNPNYSQDPTHKSGKFREWWERVIAEKGFKILKVPLHWMFTDQFILCEVKE